MKRKKWKERKKETIKHSNVIDMAPVVAMKYTNADLHLSSFCVVVSIAIYDQEGIWNMKAWVKVTCLMLSLEHLTCTRKLQSCLVPILLLGKDLKYRRLEGVDDVCIDRMLVMMLKWQTKGTCITSLGKEHADSTLPTVTSNWINISGQQIIMPLISGTCSGLLSTHRYYW